MKIALAAFAFIASLISAYGQSLPVQGIATYISESAAASSGYATPQDLACITGSATKIVKVTAVNVKAGATAATAANYFLIKRSTADTGGAPASQPKIPYDSNDPAASAVVNIYTSLPALGTNIGMVRNTSYLLPALSPGPVLSMQLLTRDYLPSDPVGQQKKVILRGVAEYLCINFVGAALPAGYSAVYTFEWTEQ